MTIIYWHDDKRYVIYGFFKCSNAEDVVEYFLKKFDFCEVDCFNTGETLLSTFKLLSSEKVVFNFYYDSKKLRDAFGFSHKQDVFKLEIHGSFRNKLAIDGIVDDIRSDLCIKDEIDFTEKKSRSVFTDRMRIQTVQELEDLINEKINERKNFCEAWKKAFESTQQQK